MVSQSATMRFLAGLILLGLLSPSLRPVSGQEPGPDGTAAQNESKSDPQKTDGKSAGNEKGQDNDPKVEQDKKSGSSKVDDVKESVKDAVDDVTKKIESSEEAHQAKSSILEPIYKLAESFSFAAFHWVAFALMATGVVSFALQLVIGKLLLLMRMKFSVSEVLADLLGLVISVIGLVLTTQAATENSQFTQSAAAVLSATAVGVILGFMFFLVGYGQESQAARARRK